MNNIKSDEKNVKKGNTQLLKKVETLAARLVKEKLSFLSILLMFELWVFTQLRSFFSYTDGKENIASNFWEFSGKFFSFLLTVPITIMLWFLVKPVICLSGFLIVTVLIANKLWS